MKINRNIVIALIGSITTICAAVIAGMFALSSPTKSNINITLSLDEFQQKMKQQVNLKNTNIQTNAFADISSKDAAYIQGVLNGMKELALMKNVHVTSGFLTVDGINTPYSEQETDTSFGENMRLYSKITWDGKQYISKTIITYYSNEDKCSPVNIKLKSDQVTEIQGPFSIVEFFDTIKKCKIDILTVKVISENELLIVVSDSSGLKALSYGSYGVTKSTTIPEIEMKNILSKFYELSSEKYVDKKLSIAWAEIETDWHKAHTSWHLFQPNKGSDELDKEIEREFGPLN